MVLNDELRRFIEHLEKEHEAAKDELEGDQWWTERKKRNSPKKRQEGMKVNFVCTLVHVTTGIFIFTSGKSSHVNVITGLFMFVNGKSSRALFLGAFKGTISPWFLFKAAEL